jgi:hypothetical protein
MEERKGAYRVLVRKPDGKRLLKYLSVNGRIALKWNLKKSDGLGMDWIDLA